MSITWQTSGIEMEEAVTATGTGRTAPAASTTGLRGRRGLALIASLLLAAPPPWARGT